MLNTPIISNTPKVSVILPIYNQEKFLQKALDSLSEQTLTDTEYICVNDGSTDNSLHILKEHAKKTHVSKFLTSKIREQDGLEITELNRPEVNI